MAAGDTWLNAFLGAVATVVLAFLPLSPVLGGALAGYLQGEDAGAVRVGALSGALAAIPMAGVFVLLGGVFAALPFGVALLDGPVGPTGAFSVLALLFAAAMFVFTVAYTVGLSALGGLVGGRVAGESGQ
ncbi:MAG: DUF5518 domain-containing protein [Halobacteriaceae archaeon]